MSMRRAPAEEHGDPLHAGAAPRIPGPRHHTRLPGLLILALACAGLGGGLVRGADFDKDGLDDAIEVTLGTSTNNWDSDADQLPDGWEVLFRLDPNDGGFFGDHGAFGDPDVDGLLNIEEYWGRDGERASQLPFVNGTGDETDPKNSDTDDDGLDDLVEFDATEALAVVDSAIPRFRRGARITGAGGLILPDPDPITNAASLNLGAGVQFFRTNLVSRDWTLECYVKPAVSGLSGDLIAYRIPFPAGATYVTRDAYRLALTAGVPTVRFHASGTGAAYGVSSGQSLPTNAWTHLAAIWDNAADRLTLYVDGVAYPQTITRESVSYYGPMLGLYSTNPPVMAASDGSFINKLCLDEVRIWGYARTADELSTARHYRLEHAVPGLLANFHFDDGGDSAVDLVQPRRNWLQAADPTTLRFANHGYAAVDGFDFATACTAPVWMTNEFGRLQVVLVSDGPLPLPPEAGWHVDNGALQPSGAVATQLTPTDHLLSYAAPSAWLTPTNERVVIPEGGLLIVTTRVAVASAWLQVQIEPPEAGDAGAQWQVDGGNWFTNGAIVGVQGNAPHLLGFADAPPFDKPDALGQDTPAGMTTTVFVTYSRIAVSGTVSSASNWLNTPPPDPPPGDGSGNGSLLVGLWPGNVVPTNAPPSLATVAGPVALPFDTQPFGFVVWSPTSGTYVALAWIDGNGNNRPDPGEPHSEALTVAVPVLGLSGLELTVEDDHDGDGLPDWWEIGWFDDLDETADGDPDNDLVDNADELLLDLDPTNPDTDGDGTPDGAEDSDGDGLGNADERRLHDTDPLQWDTDDDTWSDGDELDARIPCDDRHITSPLYARSPLIQRSLMLDGSGIDVPEPEAATTNSRLSLSNWRIACWFKPVGVQSGVLIARQTASGRINFAVRLAANEPIVSFTTEQGREYSVSSGVAIPTNVWTLLTGEWAPADATLRLYVNEGVFTAQAVMEPCAVGPGATRIGTGVHGWLDDLQIGPATGALPNPETPPTQAVAWFRFDDGGAHAEDTAKPLDWDYALQSVTFSETEYVWDPTLPDVDADGLPDWWEDLFFAGAAVPTLDTERDLLNNLYEYLCDSNPKNRDTNGDGVLDDAEDYDGDELSNSDEQFLGSDPRLLDTDDDGVSDIDELLGETSPTNALSPEIARALALPGLANGYAEFPEQSRFALREWTVEAWVQPAAAAAGTIIERSCEPGVANFLIGLTADGRPFAGFGNNWVTSAKPLATDAATWTHLAARYRRSDHKLTLLTNAVEAVTRVCSADPRFNGVGPVTQRIGAGFDGLIDDVRIWNLPRSDADIYGDYRFPIETAPASLVAWYRFDDGTAYEPGDSGTSLKPDWDQGQIQDFAPGFASDWLTQWRHAATLLGGAQVAGDGHPYGVPAASGLVTNLSLWANTTVIGSGPGDGTGEGRICVGAWSGTLAEPAGAPISLLVVKTGTLPLLRGPYRYTIYTRYLGPHTVMAWMDGDGDGRYDLGEPRGNTVSIEVVNAAPVPVGFAIRDDRDSDGLPDWWEIGWFGDLDEVADGDPDGDQVTNADELLLELNPRSSDSDGDGTPDGAEDYDGDGLGNTAERLLHGTEPAHWDTDDDGWSDGDELDARAVCGDRGITSPRYARSPLIQRALALDGSAIDVPESATGPGGSRLSRANWRIECWFKSDAIQTGDLLVRQTASGRTNFALRLNANIPEVSFTTAQGRQYRVTSGVAVPPNAWTHLTGEWSPDEDTLRLYVNAGVFAAQAVLEDCATGTGATQLGSSLTGWLDDLRIGPATGALPDPETPPTQALAWFRFDDGGAYAEDTAKPLDWDYALQPVTFSETEYVWDPTLPDADADGLPDWWEALFFSGTAAPTADTDADLLNNLYEYLCDCNPKDSDTDGDGTLDDAEDRDGDGLLNGDEQFLAADPRLPDTDDDGVSDIDELLGSTSPTSALSPEVTRALELPGQIDAYAEFPEQSRFALREWTVEAWVKPTAAAAGTVIERSCEPGVVNYRMGLADDGSPFAGFSGNWVTSALPIAANSLTWTHLAARYRRSDHRLTLFTNGVAAVTRVCTADPRDNGVGPVTQRIGAGFRGLIDDLRIWSAARDDVTIRAEFTFTLPGSDSGLAAYYRFDDGTSFAAPTDGTSLVAEWQHGQVQEFRTLYGLDWLLAWRNAASLRGGAGFSAAGAGKALYPLYRQSGIVGYFTPAEVTTNGAAWGRIVSAATTNWYGHLVFAPLAAGTYTIPFAKIPGWISPAAQQVTVVSGTSTLVLGQYYRYDTLGGPGSTTGRFNKPRGLALTAAGDLYVADCDNHRLQLWNRKSGTWSTIGGPGTTAGAFNQPFGIDVDSAGNLYVADTGNHRVQYRSAATGTWYYWGGPSWGSELGQFNGPYALAVAPAGTLYVADHYNHRVQKRSAAGTWSIFLANGAATNQVRNPSGVAVDNAGNVYVSDYDNFTSKPRVRVFAPSGAFVRSLSDAAVAAKALTYSRGADLLRDTSLMVADRDGNRALQFDPQTALWSQVVPTGWLTAPEDTACDDRGEVFIADTGANRIVRILMDPLQSSALVLAPSPLTGGGLRLQWATRAGWRYRVEWTDDLRSGHWQVLSGAANILGDGTRLSADDPLAGSAATRFYRVTAW